MNTDVSKPQVNLANLRQDLASITEEVIGDIDKAQFLKLTEQAFDSALDPIRHLRHELENLAESAIEQMDIGRAEFLKQAAEVFEAVERHLEAEAEYETQIIS